VGCSILISIVLQCVEMCSYLLQCVAVGCRILISIVLQCVEMCSYLLLLSVSVCCGLQWVAVY